MRIYLKFQWYRENKNLRKEAAALKRQSTLLMTHVSDTNPDFDLSAMAGLVSGETPQEEADELSKLQQQQHELEVNQLMSKIKGKIYEGFMQYLT